MRRRRFGIGAGAVALAMMGAGLVLTAARAQQPPAEPPRQGTAERVGETIDDALKSIRREFRDLSGEAQDRLARARASVGAMGVEARIYGRLHWEKSLNAANLGVEVDRDGRAILRGAVADAAAKARAVELARNTVGVTEVTDRLTVAAPAATTPAP